MTATDPQTTYPRADLDSEVRRRLLTSTMLVVAAVTIALGLLADLLGWAWEFVPLAALAVAASLAAHMLAPRLPRLASAVVIATATSMVLFVTGVLARGEAMVLLCLPTLLAGMLLGIVAGVGAAGAATAAIWLYLAPASHGGWGVPVLATALLWAPLALLWLYRRSALEVVDWAWTAAGEMRIALNEALSQRVELKQTQEDLVHANLQLERLSQRLAFMTQIAEEARQAKETFLASVSHELRTPLNMIIGFGEMITENPEVYGSDLPPSLLADIAVIQRNSQHLAGLVDDILDLSRSDAGRMALSKEWATLDDVARAAADAVRPLFDSKGLYLRVVVGTELPMVHCDRTRIRQVALNLLSNAGRFTVQGGAELRLARETDDVICSVTDTGPGIPPEDRERIFEPFQQAESSILRRKDGSGLGLSISKRFVEMHGGRMWLESEVGRGTTVSFRLPISEPAPRQGAGMMRWFGPYTQHEPRDRPSRAPALVVRPRFVVLDPGQVLARMLRRTYYDAEIVPVSRLQEALAELAESPATALLVNDERGEALLHEEASLGQIPQGTPALVCWAPSERELAQRLGVHGYLVKPVNRGRLLAMLEELGDAVRKVLVVDDDREAVQLLSRLLQSAPRDYEVLRATRGSRALALMRRDHPDLVLLDMVMPEMDGHEVLRRQRADDAIRDIPIIAITGQTASAALAEGRCVTVVRPPGVPLDELLARVMAVTCEQEAASTKPGALERRETTAG